MVISPKTRPGVVLVRMVEAPNTTPLNMVTSPKEFLSMPDLSSGIIPPNKAMAGPGGKHHLLDKDGIAAPGSKIMPSDVYVNKQSPSNTR